MTTFLAVLRPFLNLLSSDLSWSSGSSSPPAKLILGKSNGVLAEGTITSANLTGPLAGKTIKDLINVMRSGNAYVNVHTKQNPAGEIRGQIK